MFFPAAAPLPGTEALDFLERQGLLFGHLAGAPLEVPGLLGVEGLLVLSDGRENKALHSIGPWILSAFREDSPYCVRSDVERV